MDNHGNNNRGNGGVAPVVPPAAGPIDPAVNPWSGLEDAVAGTKTATEAPTASPVDQFNAQFGSGTPPPAPAKDTAAPTMQPGLGTIPTTEAVAQPEQNPAEELKQKISDDVDTFLAEEAKEKPAA